MSTEHVLATIDEALEDWTVSGDAMRWTPDSAAVEPTGPPVVTVDPQVIIQPFVDAMSRAAKQMARALIPIQRTLARHREREAARRHQPIALRIDGHEYRRRQRARKGRR